MQASRYLHVLQDPPLDGPTNMARDEHLLYSELLRPAAVRIYAWDPPTISLGYFQRFADLARLPAEVRDLAVVRRLTGGGAILHDREVTYCLVVDESVPAAAQSPIALYRLVHECWRAALVGQRVVDTSDGAARAESRARHARRPATSTRPEPRPPCPEIGRRYELAPDDFPMPTPRTGPFFCFEKPGRTDLIVCDDQPGGATPLNRVKLLGSAQRRIPGRVLQHGSLLLGRRFAAHPGADLGEPPPERLSAWIETFLNRLGAALDLPCQPGAWTPVQLAEVAQRREKYAGDAWTQRR